MKSSIKIKVLVADTAVKFRMENDGTKLAEVNLTPSAAEQLGEELFKAGREAAGRAQVRRKR